MSVDHSDAIRATAPLQQESEGELVRLCARLFHVVLGDVQNPVIESEFSDLAREVVPALLRGSDPSFQRAALERLKSLCRAYDIV